MLIQKFPGPSLLQLKKLHTVRYCILFRKLAPEGASLTLLRISDVQCANIYYQTGNAKDKGKKIELLGVLLYNNM